QQLEARPRDRGRFGYSRRKPDQPRLLAAVLVRRIGSIERLDQLAKDIRAIARRGRHLHVAEVAVASAVRAGAKGAHQVRLAGAGLASEAPDPKAPDPPRR